MGFGPHRREEALAGPNLESQLLLALFSARQRILLVVDNRQRRGKLRVGLDPGALVVGELSFVVDGFDGAFRDTRPAVNAFIGIDVEHLSVAVKAIHGTH